MAINKNDYLDGNGDYDLKKDLVDELIDGVNTHETDMATKVSSLSTALPTATNEIRRSGNVVTIHFYTTGSVTGTTPIATVPAGYRPYEGVNIALSFKREGNLINYLVTVRADGNIVQSYTGGAITDIGIFGTYIIQV